MEITPEIRQLVRNMVGAYYKRVKSILTSLEWEDLESAAYEGVIKHNRKTESLPSNFIRWAIIDEIRRWSHDTKKTKPIVISTEDVEELTDKLIYEYEIEKMLYLKRAGICIHARLRHYSDLQRRIAESYYFGGLTQLKIAKELNTSIAYISQVLNVVREKLLPELEPWEDL